jgi:hypothetical protein
VFDIKVKVYYTQNKLEDSHFLCDKDTRTDIQINGIKLKIQTYILTFRANQFSTTVLRQLNGERIVFSTNRAGTTG